MSAAPEIIAALLKTQTQVGQLGKADFNAHGKYHFVSIDAYYEKVARVATANGLTWICQCVGAVPFGEKAVRFDYSYDVMHQSGVVAVAFFQHPIIMSLQGAQTAGAALSYADKLFMRHAFRVVTGEQDADATAPDLETVRPPIDLDLPPRAPQPVLPAPARTSVASSQDTAKPQAPAMNGHAHPEMLSDPGEKLMREVRAVATGLADNKPVLRVPGEQSDFALIEKVFVAFVDMCESRDELIDFWNVNIEALEMIEKLDAYRHNVIRTRFTARKAVIERQEGL